MAERLLKINQLIRKELGRILHREVEFPEGVLVTITRVEVSPDLNQVRVYISAMPENKEREVFTVLKKSLYILQQRLNKKLNMRPLPRIIFKREEQIREAGRIEELLEKIKSKNE